MKIPLLFSLSSLALASLAPAVTLYGVSDTNQLIRFDSANPSVPLGSSPITGLVGTDGVTADPFATLLNLTYRPADGFYGIDSNANFYRVDGSGAATLISSSLSPTGFSGGLAYDPFTDGFAFVTDAAENFTLTVGGATASNPALAYGVGDVNEGVQPTIFALGIDPAFGSAYFLDSATDSLVRSFSPDLAELFTVGALGLDVTSFGGLMVDEDGNLFASLSTDGLNSSLYSIDATTGAASLIGALPSGVSSFAVPEPSALLLSGLGLAALIRRRRAA